jgi:hypothetical protein
MGWLVLLLRNFLIWVDRLSEGSILKAVPELEHLLLNPEEALAGREITVGPARKYATAFVLLAATAFLGWWVAAVFLFMVKVGNNLGVVGTFVLAAIFLIWLSFAALLVGCFFWLLRVLRGGRMVWTLRGAEFHHRGTVVFCPWELFNTSGQPFRPGREQVVLPVAPLAVARVEAQRHGHLVAEGLRVNTPQWKFRSGNEAVLAALYEVNTLELAKVLLHLGRILGTGPVSPKAALEFPPAEEEKREVVRLGRGGWVTVSLTRLVFPPRCCDCGAATTGREKFCSVEPFFSFARLLRPTRREGVQIWAPVCYPCQTTNRDKLRRAVVIGVAIGLGLILLAALATCLWPANMLVVLGFIFAVLLGPFFGSLIGYRIGKARAMPIQLRDYSPGQGTVAIRFRRLEYGEEVLNAIRANGPV